MSERGRAVPRTYEEWDATVHERVQREPVWQFLGYRKALFLYDLAWEDCENLMRDRRGKAIAGSISANIEEGHGRGYGKQRNWFFAVSIGSARESKGWYWRARRLLSSKVLDYRLSLADEIIALLVSELSRQRSRQTADAPTR